MNYFFNISEILLAAIQNYQHFRDRHGIIPKILQKYYALKYLFFTIITSSDIHLHARFGARLSLPHPNGVVVHQDAIIGDDCMIMQQVTIGQLASGGAPRLGSRVYVGAGAKVLGGITIGDGARIGANSVVLLDVPAGATAIGIPAIIKIKS
jgi:serine O-acetyltransferase